MGYMPVFFFVWFDVCAWDKRQGLVMTVATVGGPPAGGREPQNAW
jgi:hypothetical protein